MRSPVPDVPRPRCLRCMRPVVTCYCAALTRIETRTRVVILQHPRERDMPIGTARMASLCLPNSKIHVGVRWEGSRALAEATGDPERPAILLWPGEGARDVLADPPRGPVTLVVIDGTWAQAKSVFRDDPALRALPRYAFRAPEPSTYRIRREPRAEYVSTIEALMHVLGALEGEPERFRALLVPMAAMIDAHLTRQDGARKARVRFARAKIPPARRVPPEILDRPDDLVCVAGEADAGRGATGAAGAAGARHALVHWVARRFATGETFDAVARPPRPLAAGTPVHSEIPAERILAGPPCADVVAAFARWLRPTDVVCAWGDHGTSLFEESGGVLPAARIELRAVARRLSRGRGLTEGPVGSLEEYAARIAPDAVSPDAGPSALPPPPGRAGRRVAAMARVLAAWRAAAPR